VLQVSTEHCGVLGEGELAKEERGDGERVFHGIYWLDECAAGT
jgi:hypothetical protein